MENLTKTVYKKLRLNDAFKFLEQGDTYIKCRGGYRPGNGGDLCKFNFMLCTVFKYKDKIV